MYVIDDTNANHIFDIIKSLNINENSDMTMQNLKYLHVKFLVKLESARNDEYKKYLDMQMNDDYHWRNGAIKSINHYAEMFINKMDSLKDLINKVDDNNKKLKEIIKS